MSLAQRIPFSFMPFRPSPLSTHDSNAYQPANFAPPSGTGLCEPRAPKRGSKYSTLVKDKVKERDRQHDVFLKKVRQASEDRRWNVRGEQNLRLDFITRRREWEEEQRRRAEVEVAPIVEDGDMDDESANADSQDVDVLEELLSQEGRELEAMFDSMGDQQGGCESQESAMTDYGSEDDEYDRVLMEIIKQAEQGSNAEAGATANSEHQDTDVFMG